jgi:hypothetical protein
LQAARFPFTVAQLNLMGVARSMFVIGCWLLVFLVARGRAAESQSVAASTEVIPEIEILRAPYLKNLALIASTKDGHAKPITNAYVADLDRLARDLTAHGDVPGVDAVKAERDRAAANQTPTATEHGSMPAALLALRLRYESDLDRMAAPYKQLEQQQTRQYVSALDTEQRRLLAENEVQKAAAVAAERASVAGTTSPKPGGKEKAKPEAGTAASSVHATGKLDQAIAEKIAAAVKAQSYTKTISSSVERGQKGWVEALPEGAVLVGFEFMQPNGKTSGIRSLRPYYMTSQAVLAGKDRGKMETVTEKVLARPGFAVAGLLSSGGKSALQVIFMKLDPQTGTFDTNPNNVYKSQWFGAKSREKPVQIGGEGHLVIGIYGETGSDCDSIGLVEMQ